MTRWWLILGGALFVLAMIAWLLYMGLDLRNPDFGDVLIGAITLGIIVVGAVWRRFHAGPEPDLDQLTNALAQAMRDQWARAAIERRLLHPAPLPIRWCGATQSVAGPPAAATSARRGPTSQDPLPGLSRVTAGRLRGGTQRTLHAIYGGLPSGRLLIIGGPGAGKSSAAILLLLDALRYREQATPTDRPHIPVPVMFTLHAWDPATEPVVDWLTTKLAEIPMFRGRRGAQRAASLLRAGRISVFLDGLDEIPEAVRPLALQALSEQTTFRLVLLTRTKELADAAASHALISAAAIELQPLEPSDVAEYLLGQLTAPAPIAWQRVASALTDKPDSAVAKALTTPLAVTLIRDIYPPAGPIDELLDDDRFPEPAEVTNHLLDNAIAAAYTPRPGQPPSPYTVEIATRTLTCIARYLNRHDTRDLLWWHIPDWIPRIPRTVLSGLLGALVGGLIGGFGFGVSLGVASSQTILAATGFVVGSVVGFVIGLVTGTVMGLIGSGAPRRISHSWRRMFTVRSIMIGLAFGFVMALSTEVLIGVVFGIAAFLSFGLTVEVGGVNASDTNSVSPREMWRSDIRLALVAALVFLPVLMLAPVLSTDDNGILIGLAVAPAAVTAGLLWSEAWTAAVSQVYLTIRHRTPLRLVRFLEDARSRHLIRTVGATYQFRHATLQDRLASG